jgi:lipopolysaccharide cholinephosphotransferase
MTLDVLHDKLYDVLCLVDDICKREGVRYFLDGGTEIGSVREKDFIPWDDDIDIKVLREDYPQFKAAMLRNLPDNYQLVEPQEYSPYFFDFVPRIIDTTLPLREETDEDRAYNNYQNRVGVDIFIFEKAPDSAVAQRLMMLKCKTLYGMAMSKRFKVSKEKYSLSQKLMSSVCMLMGKPFKYETMLSMWDKSMRAYENRQTKWRFPANYLLRDLRFFKDECFSDVAYGEIRNRKFPIPVGYDEELTLLYGEYMKPPKDRSIYQTHI